MRGEKSDCEKVFKDLVPKTLNYQEWELGVLLGSGGLGGMLLNVIFTMLNALVQGVKFLTSP